jgi:hypothetical protein
MGLLYQALQIGYSEERKNVVAKLSLRSQQGDIGSQRHEFE